jgi:hypothetical protein
MNIIEILPSAFIGIISSCIAAYLSSSWAVKKFYKEKRWERKNEAYEEIINALYNLLQYCEIEKKDYGQGSGYSDGKKKEIIDSFNQGYWTIKKISTLKQYFYSNDVCSILDKLNNREKLEWNENPSWEIYENEYIAYKNALDDIIKAAKRDLRIK